MGKTAKERKEDRKAIRKQRLEKKVGRQIKKQEKKVGKIQKRILKSAEKVAKKKSDKTERITERITHRKSKGKKTKKLEQKQKNVIQQMEKILGRKMERAITVRQRMDKRRKALKDAVTLGKKGLVFVANHPKLMKDIIEIGGDFAAGLLIVGGTYFTGGIATGPVIALVGGIRTAQTGLKKVVEAVRPIGTAIEGADALKASFKEGASFLDLMTQGASEVAKVAATTDNKAMQDLNDSIQSSMKTVNEYMDKAKETQKFLDELGLGDKVDIKDIGISAIDKATDQIETNIGKKLQSKEIKGVSLSEENIKVKIESLKPSKNKKGKRKPTAYNLHMQRHMKGGGTFKSGAAEWNAKKKPKNLMKN